jgi:hypothetical protein
MVTVRTITACAVTLAIASITSACSSATGEDGARPAEDAPAQEDDLTAAGAARLGVPLAALDATFFFKPSSMDQSGLGLVLGDGIAWAQGATSQALPSMTTLDRKAFAPMMKGNVEVAGVLPGRYGAFFDFTERADEGQPPRGTRLLARSAPPLFDVAAMKDGGRCRVLGTEMDMYASGPPRVMSLEATTEHVRTHVARGVVVAYEVIARTTRSTGGDGSLLVCDGKLAGITSGAGSQGTTFEFRSVDAELLKAFADAKTAALTECRRRQKCR